MVSGEKNPSPTRETIEQPAAKGQLARFIAERQAKAEALRSLGYNPYRNDFSPSHTTKNVREFFAQSHPADPPTSEPLDPQRFRLAGRIVELRSFGKAAFIKIADRDGRLQVYVRRDVLGDDAYAAFKKAESWDFVGVSGYGFFTKMGELTVMAEEAFVLTKAVRPPPEKWSGLKDHETRYRQRYVDLVANPDIAQVFRLRTKVIKYLRAFLDQHDFLEVETPILHPTLGGAAAKPFTTQHNALNMPLYLRIAPELYLKRLIVGGFERVYEIGRNFRNEGLSRAHNPEFSMLEFYRAYATFETMIEMTEQMLCGLVQQVLGGETLCYGEEKISFARPWMRISLADAVIRATQALTPRLDASTVESAAALSSWCDETGLTKRDDTLGKGLRAAQDHGSRLGVLFDQLGEDALPRDRPVFVVDYPASTSPLARRNDTRPDYVDRFELFIAGREISNAFSELNDPLDQRQRFAQQVNDRRAGDDEAMEYDEDYCRALEYGMPPTAGAGIGIDRLVMLITNQASIRDVLLFPHLRPEGLS